MRKIVPTRPASQVAYAVTLMPFAAEGYQDETTIALCATEEEALEISKGIVRKAYANKLATFTERVTIH